jgi:hypothetical protein
LAGHFHDVVRAVSGAISILTIQGLRAYSFATGFDAGLIFFGGAETPMLNRRKPNPLRSESSMLIVPSPFQAAAVFCQSSVGR